MNYKALLSILKIRESCSHGEKNIILLVDENDIEAVSQSISFFLPKYCVVEFCPPDHKLFGNVSQSLESSIKRLSVLADLATNSYCKILVTTISAISRKIPAPDFVKTNRINLVVGASLNMSDLISQLVRLGYSRCVNAFHQGEFAVRGSIVDIVYASSAFGYRIDYFGDKIESIRVFDVNSQISVGHDSDIVIGPCREVVLDDATKKSFADAIRARFGLRYEDLISDVNNDILPIGVDDLLSLFHVKLFSIFDYLDKRSWIFEYSSAVENGCAVFFDALNVAYKELSYLSQDALPSISLNELYEEPDFIDMHKGLFSEIGSNDSELGLSKISIITSISHEAKLKNQNKFEMLLDKLISEERKEGEVFVICCSSDTSLMKIKNVLLEYDIAAERVSSYDALSPKEDKKFVYMTLFICDVSFSYNGIFFIAESDLIGDKLSKKSNYKRDAAAFLFSDLNALNVGDIVVHIEHGIGVFEGLETISVLRIAHDFVKIGYADGDKFYLPVENLDLLTKYGSFEHSVKLDKLGAASWQARKAKLKNRIKVAAESLLKIAAARNQATMPFIEPEKELYNKFVNAFPYIETEDQEKAIDDILSDLFSGKPMDRLVCGDVGFGKTEVALRAAFAVVSSAHQYQVAILVPTTLLSRQHNATFTQRFEGMPFNIKELSKFTKRSEVKLIKEGIKNGDVDIIIGTHALLAKDIIFKNLGLIIIDEEQHFGVAQKERLKQIKHNAHVLTLSATPIPRTLQMSLFGIKDLSIIATPPVNRLPIKTYVIPGDLFAIREAILREIDRGGRVFYITPRVKYIDGLIDQLKKSVPEAKIISAHGSMSASELDSIMNAFFDGKYNVLVSTTIIESGLDIPDANTIIIDRSHYFGLSQLHQIRGRVGRGNKQAFAYITYPQGLKLSKISEHRLS
ncbi:MAG: DEAD/DEAH box helicase, partial [Alphaproteobacteria bacterium]